MHLGCFTYIFLLKIQNNFPREDSTSTMFSGWLTFWSRFKLEIRFCHLHISRDFVERKRQNRVPWVQKVDCWFPRPVEEVGRRNNQLNGCKVSFWTYENVLELDGGRVCIHCECTVTKSFTLKWLFHIIWTLPQLKKSVPFIETSSCPIHSSQKEEGWGTAW